MPEHAATALRRGGDRAGARSGGLGIAVDSHGDLIRLPRHASASSDYLQAEKQKYRYIPNC